MEKKLQENENGRAAKLSERLREMAETDVRTVDRETLVDISNIKIDVTKPKSERLKSYLEQVGNPYIVRIGDVIVEMEYAKDHTTMQQRILDMGLSHKNGVW